MSLILDNAGTIAAVLASGLTGIGIGLQLRGKAPPSGNRLR